MAIATRLFAERGYDATTTAAIADGAGITEPVLYRHFESKKHLFIAVLRNSTALLIGRWKAATAETPDAAEQIRRMAAIIYNSLSEISDAQRVIYGAAATSCDPDVRAVIKDHADQFAQIALAIIRHGQQAGEFRQDMDTQAMAWSVVNIYTGFSFTRLHFPAEHLDIRVGVELIVTGLCQGRCATPRH
jgi:AcrR family transcriptional regulator